MSFLLKSMTLGWAVLLLSFRGAFSQTTEPWSLPGACSSYQVLGNEVIFITDRDASISLKFLSSDVIKVWYSPAGDFQRSNPSFAVVNEKLSDLDQIQVTEQSQLYEIFTSTLRVRIEKSPFRIQIYDKYQKLVMGDFEDAGLVDNGQSKAAYKQMRADEQFFGLGEKAGPLNRRGHSYTMWNSDIPCYDDQQDPLYKSIPFFMSSYRYGIFLDNTYKTKFKFGTESDQYYSFETPDGELIYYFIYGKEYKDIISKYTQLTGKPIMPPKWAFGFSQSRGLYTRQDQAMEVSREFRKRSIPIDIIFQDIGWTQYLQDFEWRTGNYSNPKLMLDSLTSMGFKMIVSQDPVISQANKPQWAEADSLGFLVKDARTGEAYDMPWPWGGNAGVVDFTMPDVADWWGSYQQKPIDDGVKGYWTDMGEPAWSNEESTDRLHMKHHAGMHAEIHNVYGLTWDKVVTEEFEKRNPNQRIFQMTRAAYAGLQRYTFGWSGDSGNGADVLSGWKNLANQIPLSLSAGMGLIPFWATDISGYCGDITDYDEMSELYVRWLQFGLFNPLSRAHHEGDNAVEPWLFGKEAERIARNAIEMKYQLFPYIYTYAREAYDSGIPLMRALILEYPNDNQAHSVNDQFMLGESLLVAPVVSQGAKRRKIYFPEGTWIDFNNKRTAYEGSQEIDIEAPLEVIPTFVKKGSIIPMMPVMQYIHEQEDYTQVFEIFPSDKLEKSIDFELYEDDGLSNDYKRNVYLKTKIGMIANDNGYKISIDQKSNEGYVPVVNKNSFIKLYVSEKPKSITLNSVKVKKRRADQLLEAFDDNLSNTAWAWDEVAGCCYIHILKPSKHSEVIVIN